MPARAPLSRRLAIDVPVRTSFTVCVPSSFVVTTFCGGVIAFRK
jgi:hypothetical protein